MGIGSWLKNIEFIAPLILPLIPGFPAVLTPFVVKGIQHAETIEGADGKTKLAAAVNEVNNGIEALNAVKPGVVNPSAVNSAIVNGINTVIAVTNIKTQSAPAALNVAAPGSGQ